MKEELVKLLLKCGITVQIIPKELQDEMDRYVRQFQDEFGLGDDSVYDRAYKEMWLQHGADFRRAFNHWDGYLEIRDEKEAARFLGVGVIDDTRLDNTTVELTDKKEIALYIPDVDPFEKDDTITFRWGGRRHLHRMDTLR